MRRVLCLWLPNWPIQRLTVAEPALERRVVVLTSEVPGRGEVVSACNERARRRGIDPGMPVSEARTLLPRHETLQAMPWRPDADRRALTQLALRCERFSPCAGLEESEYPESVLLEVTGVAHLFSGEASFVAQVERDVAEQYPSVRLALADSVGAAWAAAHFLTQRQQPVVIVPPGRPEVLWPLPVEGLRLSAANVRALKRLGITTVGQVFQLDRASLPARFGPEINRRWAQLLGERDERITACRARPAFQVSRILEEGTTHGEAIEQLWSSLLERLVESLRAQQQGVLHLRCQWMLEYDVSAEHGSPERGKQLQFDIRLCRAMANARHLGELLQLKLQQCRFAAPLIGVRLRAMQTAPLGWQQRECFSGRDQDHARAWAAFLDRLSSRLGDEAVTHAVLVPDPIPERAVRFVPVNECSQTSATVQRFAAVRNSTAAQQTPPEGHSLLPLDRPTCLWSSPKPVDVTGLLQTFKRHWQDRQYRV